MGQTWLETNRWSWYGNTLEDSFWQHKRVVLWAIGSISLNFRLVVCSTDMNLYIWNVLQTLSTFLDSKGSSSIWSLLSSISSKTAGNLCVFMLSKCHPVTGSVSTSVWCFVCMCVIYLTVTPSFSRTRMPFSWYSSLVIQKLSLSFMMSASTAPPKNTMCLRRGGSSMRILNFYRKRKERFSETAMLYVCEKTQKG